MYLRYVREAILGAALAAGLAACGGGGSTVEGAYIPQGDTFFDSLSLLPAGQAEVVLVGVTHPGSYTVDGDQVMLVAASGTQTPFSFDGKCLSQEIAGTYCRSGAAAAPAASAAAGSGGTEVYRARLEEGMISLELQPGGRAVMSMSPLGGGEDFENLSFTVSYETTGDGVTVSMPGDDPIRFTRTGSDLVATMDGETARFVRQ